MSYSIQPSGDFIIEKMKSNNNDEVIIHESEVQDIINMMKEDLHLEKFNTQKDENLTPKTSAQDVFIESSGSGGGGGGGSSSYEEDDLSLIDMEKVNSNTPSSIQPDYNDSNKLIETEEYDTKFINELEIEEQKEEGEEEKYKNESSFLITSAREEYTQDDKDLIDFIEKAKIFNANALDLSRKNINKIPRKLLELNQLQYIYLEGNNLTRLPSKFFETFTQLRWLDLRNNQLTHIPSKGLENNVNLRCLLLENNKIARLPYEIANLRNINALNVSDNPIEYPPIDIVNKGLKQVQIYMKKEQLSKNNINIDNMTDQDIEDYFYQIHTEPDEDDVWASDVEEYYSTNNYRSKSVSKYSHSDSSINSYLRNNNAQINKNLLTTKAVNPSESQDPNLALKQRINNARNNANKLSFKLLNKRKALPPVEVAVYKNKELEKALRNGRLDTYKKTKEKIDAKLQKVNDHLVTDNFRTKLKVEQRKNQYKHLIKGVDYIEPVKQAPFDISEEHLIVMNNEDRDRVDKALANERNRPVSPNTLWQLEEERRLRDNELQERIRDYTNKLLVRRLHKSQTNPKMDRIQAVKDLKELRKIEKELEQRRTELQHNIRSVHGDSIYKETAKLNSKATISNVLKLNKF